MYEYDVGSLSLFIIGTVLVGVVNFFFLRRCNFQNRSSEVFRGFDAKWPEWPSKNYFNLPILPLRIVCVCVFMSFLSFAVEANFGPVLTVKFYTTCGNACWLFRWCVQPVCSQKWRLRSGVQNRSSKSEGRIPTHDSTGQNSSRKPSNIGHWCHLSKINLVSNKNSVSICSCWPTTWFFDELYDNSRDWRVMS